MKHRRFAMVGLTCMALMYFTGCKPELPHWIIDSEIGKLKVEVIADSIDVPFGMTFLSGGKMLVTNRSKGAIILLDGRRGSKTTLKNVPASYSRGDGGALDILAHTNFTRNGILYYSHSVGDSTGSTMAIDMAELKGDSLINVRRIFTAVPYYEQPNHFGTRMVLKDGYLFFGMGERYDLTDSAQTLGNHLGKVMRLFEDGRVPPDNPFVGRAGALPEIWSYGHRNPQGLTLHPQTKELWEHEHGPKGGDEINIIEPGINYGWPVISHGVNYDGTPVGQGITAQSGMEQPLYTYTPCIAPSGMTFYTGDKFPEWRGNLFVGGMALRHLNRLVIENNRVVHEERLLTTLEMRVRNVQQGPDGYLYVGVDGGKILRLRPVIY